MTDSLDNNKSAFSDLEYSSAVAMVGVLQETELKTQDHIRRRFLERATNFEATLKFLLKIGGITQEDEELSLSQVLSAALTEVDRGSIRAEVVALLAQEDSEYRSETFDYLRRFNLVNGLASYKPADSERSAESSVRNFLMEIGVVSYIASEDRYEITSENNFLFTLAKASVSRSISPLSFETARKRREDIGFKAEIFVLDYERKRLGQKFISRIEHVADRNAAAGYDIKSVTIDQFGKELPRYVEVKAVPILNYRFYWSSNERSVAKTFGHYYYLYLVPVGTNGTINSEALLIIENPIISVLESPDYWMIESDVIKCMQQTSPDY